MGIWRLREVRIRHNPNVANEIFAKYITFFSSYSIKVVCFK